MGLVQRAIEAAGVPSISVTMVPEITRRLGVPRALIARFPLGHPFGFPGQNVLQHRIVSLMGHHAARIAAPGTIADAGIGGADAACAVCGPVPAD